MLPAWILAVSAGVGLVGGILIGAVGVGGIIIVPSLVELPGVEIYQAIAVMFAEYHRCCRCRYYAQCQYSVSWTHVPPVNQTEQHVLSPKGGVHCYYKRYKSDALLLCSLAVLYRYLSIFLSFCQQLDVE